MSLAALLATLLPEELPWPSGAVVAAELERDEAINVVLGALPPSFVAGDEEALRRVEAQDSGTFARAVAAAYLAYYTHPEVRRVLEQVTGYAARPPQPLGYELPPFDETLLERQRVRPPFWRDPAL